MSFQVTAGEGSPTAHAPGGSALPVPASFGGSRRRDSVPSGTTPPTVPVDLSGSGGKQRRGTDPTKYKTSICRNWEAHGVCTFRGCTFAHGEDEVRPPSKSVSPNVGPSAPPARTPPTGPTPPGQAGPPLPRSAQQQHDSSSCGPTKNGATVSNSAVKEPSVRPMPRSMAQHHHASSSATANGATTSQLPLGTSPLLSGMSSLGTSPPMGASVPTGPPPPSYAAATNGQRRAFTSNFNSGTVASAGSVASNGNAHHSAGTSSPPPLCTTTPNEQVVDTLKAELNHVRELAVVHLDATSTLESMLSAERVRRRESSERLQALKAEAGALRQRLETRRHELRSEGVTLPDIPAKAAQAPLSISAREFTPGSGVTPPMRASDPPPYSPSPPLYAVHSANVTPPLVPHSSAFVGSPLTLGSGNGSTPQLSGVGVFGPTNGPLTSKSTSGDNDATSPLELKGAARSTEAEDDVTASPTDPVQKDRLRELLQSLNMGGDEN